MDPGTTGVGAGTLLRPGAWQCCSRNTPTPQGPDQDRSQRAGSHSVFNGCRPGPHPRPSACLDLVESSNVHALHLGREERPLVT